MSDYIDRNVAIDAFCSLADALNSAKAKQPNTLEAIEICGKISGIYLCKGLIRTTKSADVTPIRRGHWIKISPAGIYECSKCGQNVMTSDIEAYVWCHGCGARMDGYENEID